MKSYPEGQADQLSALSSCLIRCFLLVMFVALLVFLVWLNGR